jgi:hypothetical protein
MSLSKSLSDLRTTGTVGLGREEQPVYRGSVSRRMPIVPQFKDLQLEDKERFDYFLESDPPRISELTFTNLFMWRFKYRPRWAEYDDCLLIILHGSDGQPFGLQPVGGKDRAQGLEAIAAVLAERSPEARIGRADDMFVRNVVDPDRYHIRTDRDNSDYVYLAENLITLSGNRYHKKKNHLNRFTKDHPFEYRVLDGEMLLKFLSLQSDWCQLKDCASSEALQEEDQAVYEALSHQDRLGFRGGAILIDGQVEAFALGEKLNEDTAVIHIEKANPQISGLYAAINQQFCEKEWSQVTYVNRQQDLGVPGLRKAKKSYHPDHMVNKFTLVHK